MVAAESLTGAEMMERREGHCIRDLGLPAIAFASVADRQMCQSVPMV